MPFIEHAVIAAAGMGKRLGAGKPKCLVEVSGKKIVEYQLELLKEVENVFLVVGFCEEDVIAFTKKIRPDLIFVRNSNFQHTTTLQSFYLATKSIKGNCLLMDGDMIIDPKSFGKFMRACEDSSPWIGVSDQISSDPIYASISTRDGLFSVCDFSQTEPSAYEWANLAYLPSEYIQYNYTHLYQHLKRYLPMKAINIDRMEIDTNEDLQNAERKISARKGETARICGIV